MPDPKQDDSFRVVDRRPFTSEGELRPDVAAAEEEEQRRQATRSLHAHSAKPEPSSSPDTKSDAAAPEAPAGPQLDKNFQLLIDLLARNAAALLGGIPDPATGQAYLDLEGAREMIDMLDILREKTRGNLAPEEQSLLSDVLGSLKLSYMEVSKAAAKAMREGAKGQGRR